MPHPTAHDRAGSTSATPLARAGRGRWASTLALLLLAAGCAAGSASSPGSPGGGASGGRGEAPGGGTSGDDRSAAAALEASDADRAMAAAVAAGDLEAFVAHVAADGIFFGARGAAAGRAAVASSWARFFAPGGPRLAWTPDRALAAASGDLVFTWGSSSFTPPGGGPASAGRYLTAWRRDADGLLRVALDGSDEPLPELPPGVTRHPLRTIFSADGALLAEAGLVVDGTREAGHYLRLSRRDGPGFAALSETGAWRPLR